MRYGGVKGGVPPTAARVAPARDPALLLQEDLTYLGAFRVPAHPGGAQSPNWGGHALTYWAAHDSLIMTGQSVPPGAYWAVELSIPATPTQAATVGALPLASELQPYTDLLQGKKETVDGYSNDVSLSPGQMGGISVVPPDKFVVSIWVYYDQGTPKQLLSHFVVHGWNFSLLTPADVSGPFQVGVGFQQYLPTDTSMIAGFVSGYQCPIPAEYQAALGGTHLTGLGGGVSNPSRTSSGPSCSSYDPTQVGVTLPCPTHLLMGYPTHPQLNHPTLGVFQVPGSGIGLYDGSQFFRGMVFPDQTRSILFTGWRGDQVDFCYGIATQNPALHHQPVPGHPGQHYCYDPDGGAGSPGVHSYPRNACIFAYDVLDLIRSRQGVIPAWEVIPYRTWEFDFPFTQQHSEVGQWPDAYETYSAAWDPLRRRIYLTGSRQNNDAPVIHAWQIP